MIPLIGLDTNVLIRWLFRADDDTGQADLAAHALQDADADIWVNTVVLAELVWLTAQKLKFGRAVQSGMVHKLLDHPHVVVADRACVEQALTAFEIGGAGFVDQLIGTLNTAAGCKTTLTFDKAAAKGPHFTYL